MVRKLQLDSYFQGKDRPVHCFYISDAHWSCLWSAVITFSTKSEDIQQCCPEKSHNVQMQYPNKSVQYLRFVIWTASLECYYKHGCLEKSRGPRSAGIYRHFNLRLRFATVLNVCFYVLAHRRLGAECAELGVSVFTLSFQNRIFVTLLVHFAISVNFRTNFPS